MKVQGGCIIKDLKDLTIKQEDKGLHYRVESQIQRSEVRFKSSKASLKSEIKSKAKSEVRTKELLDL